MTETEWNECDDINKMLNFVKGQRKKRLFACACVRHVWSLLTDERSKKAVIVAEQFADGAISGRKVKETNKDALNAYIRADDSGICEVAWCAYVLSSNQYIYVSNYVPGNCLIAKNLLKDIFDPFGKIQKPKINKTIKHFANEIYNNTNENGFFNNNDLNILSDMLYDEGYDNDHLRSGKHVKGCQVIDLILGKQ